MRSTHEDHIHNVRAAVAARLNDDAARSKILSAKLVYGSGKPGVRGVCFYQSWETAAAVELIEICASGEESLLQLAGTTIHELAHCLAGPTAGHGRLWKSAAKTLGLKNAQAAGQQYLPVDFAADLWPLIDALPTPSDGRPRFNKAPALVVPRPCPLGRGTRGGKSRGPGSGSRLRLFMCHCVPPIRVRVARNADRFRVRCLECNTDFVGADVFTISREPQTGYPAVLVAGSGHLVDFSCRT